MPGAAIKVFGDNSSLSAQTDSDGRYAISSVPPGTYTVRAEAAKYETTVLAPVIIGSNETKTLNITLVDQDSRPPTSNGTPQFFDQPQFTIAGVTDTTNLGGHASGMAPSTESLAKDVNSLLGAKTAANPNAALEAAARTAADQPGGGFKENHAAGALLLEDGRPQEAIAYLLRASKLSPNDYDNSYDLARAYAGSGQFADARVLVRQLLTQNQSADLHHLLATVEEKSGNPLPAQAEFQHAAELDPSEPNLFDWAMELLTHRALDPAIAVFRNGSRRFPQSARMLSGLAAAFYERGAYDEGLQYACAATDVNLGEAAPYLLLGEIESADRGQSDAPLVRLQRFAQLQPANALANYYYALALWNRRKGPGDASTSAQVESLLQKALRLDPRLAKAHFQLGVLYSDRSNLPQAISSYENAVRVDPQFTEAHYRLAQAYAASGQKEKSYEEISLYKQKTKEKADAADRERRALQQFVYTMQPRPN